uniref:Ovule protein n=1 Tax=Brugia timori TaxID=42155 RepID=A0A0R3QFQ7_9BILA
LTLSYQKNSIFPRKFSCISDVAVISLISQHFFACCGFVINFSKFYVCGLWEMSFNRFVYFFFWYYT